MRAVLVEWLEDGTLCTDLSWILHQGKILTPSLLIGHRYNNPERRWRRPVETLLHLTHNPFLVSILTLKKKIFLFEYVHFTLPAITWKDQQINTDILVSKQHPSSLSSSIIYIPLYYYIYYGAEQIYIL